MNERAMPKPNCTGQDELDLGVIDFGRLGRREVQGCFDGGSMTSDAGVMLLSATDRKIGLTAGAARCIADPRNPLLIKHAVRDMLRQRVYGLALGWEDLNDHKALRLDVAMQTAVGVEREVASAPTLCRLESWADRATPVRPRAGRAIERMRALSLQGTELACQRADRYAAHPAVLRLQPAQRGDLRAGHARVGRHVAA